MPVGDRNGSRAQAVALGTAIRELRESLGWSQSRLASALCEVAHHATVIRENISRWETEAGSWQVVVAATAVLPAWMTGATQSSPTAAIT